MLFNSILFLLLFLPVAWAGYYLCVHIGHRVAMAWLVVVSLVFYGWWTPAYLILLCGSILFNYTIGVLIQRTVTKNALQEAILVIGVSANLLLLGYYKYLFPFLHWIENFGIQLVPPGASVLLPLGISFFTFTQIGYLVDCKAALTSGRRFLDYCLFVTFFPHLIAGPILHHREMMPQFENKETWRFNPTNIALGLSIFFIGLIKKDVIADRFAPYASAAFDHPAVLSPHQAWAGVLSYSLQLYFDFSGYSEMAIGLALLFNIRFPANFDSPYKSASIIDFWQRWHMTLTRYLNLYLYNPIALWATRYRSVKRLPVGRPGLKTASGFLSMVGLPTFVTLILIGVWHGAGFQFFIFGLLHAVYLIINHLWRLIFHKKNAPEKTGPALWFGTTWKVLLTYLAVLLAQIFFRARSTPDAFIMLARLAGRNPHESSAVLPDSNRLFMLACYFLVWFAPNVLQIFSVWEPTLSKPHGPSLGWFASVQWKPNLAWGVALGLLAAIAVLAITGQTEFLYFRF
jgi:D-alanyl-lipoteichoic acid acyltransferase DltB (MBOAT superfamily)